MSKVFAAGPCAAPALSSRTPIGMASTPRIFPPLKFSGDWPQVTPSVRKRFTRRVIDHPRTCGNLQNTPLVSVLRGRQGEQRTFADRDTFELVLLIRTLKESNMT